MEKLDIWVIRERHVNHVGQDTNATIELYHGTTKANVKSTKGHLVGHQTDSLIHELIYNVIKRYAYNDYKKEFGFVSKKKSMSSSTSSCKLRRFQTHVSNFLHLLSKLYGSRPQNIHISYMLCIIQIHCRHVPNVCHLSNEIFVNIR